MEGFWDGSSTNNGKTGCVIVMKGVDRDKWFTISRIAVLLGDGTAMAAEVMCVCSHGDPGSCVQQKLESSEIYPVH